jgi:hypothetical protein
MRNNSFGMPPDLPKVLAHRHTDWRAPIHAVLGVPPYSDTASVQQEPNIGTNQSVTTNWVCATSLKKVCHCEAARLDALSMWVSSHCAGVPSLFHDQERHTVRLSRACAQVVRLVSALHRFIQFSLGCWVCRVLGWVGHPNLCACVQETSRAKQRGL